LVPCKDGRFISFQKILDRILDTLSIRSRVKVFLGKRVVVECKVDQCPPSSAEVKNYGG